jgi:deazaflavin-dependent oxidoreductase (nitroreductase family)
MADVSVRRRRHLRLWRFANPCIRPLAGVMPWWVLLETTGCRSGAVRRTPLARGPRDDGMLWLIAVHGRRADWVRNIEATPLVRIKIGGRWHIGRASVQPYNVQIVRRFSAYARRGPRTFGIEPVVIPIELT